MRHSVIAWLLLSSVSAFAELADSGWREVFTEEPFTGAPLGVAFVKGGLGVAWGYGSGVEVFDVRTGAMKEEFAGHRSLVTAGATAPSAKLVATGDASGRVLIWDGATRREVARIEGRAARARGIFWGPTAQHVAVVTDDLVMTLYRADNGKKILENTLPSFAGSEVHFSPDGERLTLVQREGVWDGRERESRMFVTEYDLVGGRAARKLRWDRRGGARDDEPYAGARVDARRQRVALLDGDEVVIWAIDGDREVCRIDGSADAVAWRKDGRLLVSRAGGLDVCNGESGRREKRYPGAAAMSALVASEDGRIVLGAGPRGAVLWKTDTGEDPQDIGPGFDIATGKTILVVRDAEGRATVIRTEDGAMSAIQGDPPDPDTGLPMIAVSPEDDVVLHCSSGRPSAWDFDGTTETPCGEPRQAAVAGVLVAGDVTLALGPRGFSARGRDGAQAFEGRGVPVRASGKWIAARAGGRLTVWNAETGKPAAEFDGAGAFDLSGDSVAVLADGDAVVFDLARDKERFRVSAARASAIALTLNGGRVAFDNGPIQAWDVPSQKKLWSSEARGPLDAARWHPGGAMLAALGTAGEFHFINDDGSLILSTTQASPPAGENALPFDFSRDGSLLAVSWTDGPRLYQLDKGVKAIVLARAPGTIRFAPAGDRWIVLGPGRCDVYEGGEFIDSLPAEDAAFLPTGAIVCATTTSIRIWDGRWRSEVRDAAGTRISVSEDGKRLAVADGTAVRVYEK
ncbi:MAG: hypothetical protein HYY18_21365 [Planctomycetes bacterium]|nr:hypothetical protein [Planctomycetota bacterium]